MKLPIFLQIICSRPVGFRLAAWAIWALVFCSGQGFAYSLDFATFRLGSADRAALVVGGIQGDEPGGFSAATLLATHYEITKGEVWVVPNLNFPSIIKRSRGVHGDMNRKFSVLASTDPEYDTVRRIQELINRPEVALILNLHDGSGYYRPAYEDRLKNPARWGQSIIIDQESLENNGFMGSLLAEASSTAAQVNKRLIKKHHAIHVHNTNTAAGDREMEKSLSYYAVRAGKAAFGLEASKELPTPSRVYYHLLMVEELLRQAGIEFRRDFELSPEDIERTLGEDVAIYFADNKVFLPLEDARKAIKYLPLSRESIGRAIPSKPIMAVLPCSESSSELCVHYGNRTVTLISPEWREISSDLDSLRTVIDGEERIVPLGQIVDVRDFILIKKEPSFRVNAIGFDCGLKDESEVPLRRKDFMTSYSIDKSGAIFRVEVYKDKAFAGMLLVRFNGPKSARRERKLIVPDKAGPESSLGF